MSSFKGTIIILGDAIGDSIMAIPALTALHTTLPAPVILSSTTVVLSVLSGNFPNWGCISHDEVFKIESCNCIIDTWSVQLTGSWIEKVSCPFSIGARFDNSNDPYTETIAIGPFTKNSSALELYNPFARYLCKNFDLDRIPLLLNYKKNAPPKKRIGIFPGGFSPQKRWPLRHFQYVSSEAKKNGYSTHWYLGPKEDNIYNSNLADENLSRNPSISDLMSSISENILNISNDTSMMHLSGALGIKTFGIFGPSLPKQWWHYPTPSRFFQHLDAGTGNGVIQNTHEEYKYWPTPQEVLNAI
jgi:ADP-heptose:LPS heptosyltransferase